MKNVIQGTTLSGTGSVSIAPGAEITIRNPAGQLVPLWADRAGTQPHDNPFLTDNEGNFRVYADSGWVHVRAQKDGSVREWRYVPLGSAAAMDIGEIYEALGSGIYSSVSEGLSNSAEGDFFLVESSGSLDLYRVVNGVAEQRAAGIDDNAILATRAYADDVAAEAESNATNAAVAAASSAYQLATQYSDNELQTHRESGDHDGRYYTKTEVDHALEDKVDENDPRLSDAREWTAETVSQAEAEAGTSTTRRAWTAQRVRQAIVAGYNALTSAFGRTLANASDATAARDALGLGTAATRDVGTGANNVVVGSDPRLSDAREWTADVVSQAEAEAGTSTVPRKWTAERVRQAIEALGGGGIDPGDLGTAATRDVTTSPTDTTPGRVLTVGSLGLGNPILLTSSDDLDDIMSPGIYRHSRGDAPANTPILEAGIVTVFKGEPGGYVVQEWRRRDEKVRNFQRSFNPNLGEWSSWVEFYHTGNLPLGDSINITLLGVQPGVAEDQAQAIMDAAQWAVEQGVWLDWPEGVYYVDPTYVGPSGHRGVVVPSGARWRMRQGVEIRALPTDKAHYEILHLINCEDVIIEGNNARVVGERDEHLGVGGEWGMGVALRGATNVKISDLSADNCWGDGWYIGSTAEKPYCENIYLLRPSANNNRRQGMSWISGRSITIEEPRLTNTGGTEPEAGLNIEPNSPNEFVQGRIVRPYTSGNADAGIMIHLAAMLGSENPVDLVIDGHHDDGSEYGIALSGGGGSLYGQISILHPTWMNNNYHGLLIRGWQASMPRVTVLNPHIIDANRSGTASTRYGSAVGIYREAYDAGDAAIGNVYVINPVVQATGGQLPTRAIYIHDVKEIGVEKVALLDPVELVSSSHPVWVNRDVKVSDRYDVLRRDLGASRTIYGTQYYRTETNEGAVGTINIDLSDTSFLEVTILVTEAQTVRVRANQVNSELRLYPDGVTGLQCNQIGGRLTVQRRPGGFWIVERIGDWTPLP